MRPAYQAKRLILLYIRSKTAFCLRVLLNGFQMRSLITFKVAMLWCDIFVRLFAVQCPAAKHFSSADQCVMFASSANIGNWHRACGFFDFPRHLVHSKRRSSLSDVLDWITSARGLGWSTTCTLPCRLYNYCCLQTECFARDVGGTTKTNMPAFLHLQSLPTTKAREGPVNRWRNNVKQRFEYSDDAFVWIPKDTLVREYAKDFHESISKLHTSGLGH